MNTEDIRKLLANFPGIVVVDEAYIDFSTHTSATQWLDHFPNLVVLQTFSKAWGLAGIRLGMAFANQAIIDLLNKVKPPYMALENLAEQEQWVEEILAERVRMEKELESLKVVEKVYPSDANFLLVKVNDAQAIYDFLVADGIIVRNRSNVLLCEGCLRFTIGMPIENELLIEALMRFEE